MTFISHEILTSYLFLILMLTLEFLISISIVSYLWQSIINRKLFAMYTEIRKEGGASQNISYYDLNININYLWYSIFYSLN